MTAPAITDDDLTLVRLYLGDTDEANQLVTDEQIELLWNLSDNPQAKLIASDLAMGLAGKYSRSVSFSVEGLSISSSQKAEAFRQLAKELRESAASDTVTDTGASATPGLPRVSGVSVGEIASVESDADRVGSSFKIGQHDNHRN